MYTHTHTCILSGISYVKRIDQYHLQSMEAEGTTMRRQKKKKRGHGVKQIRRGRLTSKFPDFRAASARDVPSEQKHVSHQSPCHGGTCWDHLLEDVD